MLHGVQKSEGEEMLTTLALMALLPVGQQALNESSGANDGNALAIASTASLNHSDHAPVFQIYRTAAVSWPCGSIDKHFGFPQFRYPVDIGRDIAARRDRIERLKPESSESDCRAGQLVSVLKCYWGETNTDRRERTATGNVEVLNRDTFSWSEGEPFEALMFPVVNRKIDCAQGTRFDWWLSWPHDSIDNVFCGDEGAIGRDKESSALDGVEGSITILPNGDANYRADRLLNDAYTGDEFIDAGRVNEGSVVVSGPNGTTERKQSESAKINTADEFQDSTSGVLVIPESFHNIGSVSSSFVGNCVVTDGPGTREYKCETIKPVTPENPKHGQ